MLEDQNHWKTVAIRYARVLQMLLKNATMFSSTHPTVQTAIVNTFEQLNSLVKERGQFTLGFVDDRIMLNSLLTTDKTLTGIETEFLKRGIGAISFAPGITLAAYRRAILVLVAAPNLSEVEDPHALLTYLSQNQLDFVRIHPAPKGQKRTDAGDTILEMNSEEYLMSKAFSEIRTPGLDRIDAFFKSVGIPPGSGGGLGTGGGPAGMGGTVSGEFGMGAPGGLLSQQMTREVEEGTFAANTATVAPLSTAGPSGIAAMVQGYLCSNMADGDSGPQRSYLELARVIRETRPEFVLAGFSPQRREELRKLPPDQMAEEVIEDTAVKWAAEQLGSAKSEEDAVIVEREVIRVLSRTLQTTQAATRLAEKLVQYITDLKIPASTQNRIREELEWTVVPSEEKTVRLLKIEHFNAIQFKRLTQHIEEIIKAGHQAPAAYLAEHFFDSCTRDAMPAAEELGRIPEFVNCCPNLRPESWKNGVDRLLVKLATPLDQVRHLQVANGLFAIAQALARYEAFDAVNEVGAALELQLAGSEGHDACCKPALRNLLTKHVLDRILEIYQQKREDQEFARLAPVLLRRAGAAGVEKVFHELENQENAAQRMSLLRLITRIGAPAVEFAVERLKDERWYIVRNACKLLSDLRDPHILEHLGHLLEHKDERVQKAALSGVIDSRLPGRGLVLATHLGHLNGALLEDAATELIYLRDAGYIKPLVDIFEMEPQNCKAEVAALQVLATLTDESSSAALLQVVLNGKIDTVIRKTALKSLLRKTGPKYSRELRSFATQHGSDALAGDVAAALSAVGEG